jgi:hypothetical protein
MKPKIVDSLGRLGMLSGLMLGLAIAQTTAPQQTSEVKNGTGKLEGTWITQVAIRDCVSGAMLRAFSAINTFNADGTVIDTTTSASPSQRTPGFGKWVTSGPKSFSAVSLAFLFSAAGEWTGTQKLSHTIQVSVDVTGGEIKFTSTNQIFDTMGNQTLNGCATAVGRRL